MKKLFCMSIVLLLLTAMFSPVFAGENYSDLGASHWAFPYVKEMTEKKILAGYPDGSFRPEQSVRYGEFIKMLYISQTGAELPQPKGVHWASVYYAEGMKIGLYTGNDVKPGDLDLVIPRSMMALMTANAILSPEAGSAESVEETLKTLTDVDENTEYGYEIGISFQAGILNGYPDHSFRPGEGLSRGEAAAAVCRLMKKQGTDEEIPINFKGRETVKNRNFDVDIYETRLGYGSICKFVYSEKSGCIGVYSQRQQDITLFIDGNRAMPVVQPETDHWEENGFYVYVFNVGDLNPRDSSLGIAFGVTLEEVYYYTDAEI